MLTAKQQRFVEEYLIDLKATQAAIRAGYSEKTADKIGSQLLGKTRVSEAIAKAKKERAERVLADADYVLKRLVEIDKMDVLDIMDDSGVLKPLSQWPVIWRQYVSGVEVSEWTEKSGTVKKIKWPDKLRNLELIGKHVNVQAFKEKLDLELKEVPKFEVILNQ